MSDADSSAVTDEDLVAADVASQGLAAAVALVAAVGVTSHKRKRRRKGGGGEHASFDECDDDLSDEVATDEVGSEEPGPAPVVAETVGRFVESPGATPINLLSPKKRPRIGVSARGPAARVSRPWQSRLGFSVCSVLALLAGCIFGGAFIAGAGKPASDPASRVEPAAVALRTTAGLKTERIENIRVGQRVVAEKSDGTPESQADPTGVDSATWRKLTLRGEQKWPDGTLDIIEVETLQPPEWVAAHSATPGAVVPLPIDLVEMGMPEDLTARVVANDPCPAIPPGSGRVVLTTMSHLNQFLHELVVDNPEAGRESVYVTGYHKFFSETRGQWTIAAELRPGESLRGLTATLTVDSIRRLPGTHRVFNMTVEGEHVYHVSALGVLAHNNCPEREGTIYRVPGEGTPSGKPYIGRHNKPEPQKTRSSTDGRDRKKAEVVDTYDADNTREGRLKEQAAIDAEGGVPNLDNKRNEIRRR